jgi:hypothetical protein
MKTNASSANARESSDNAAMASTKPKLMRSYAKLLTNGWKSSSRMANRCRRQQLDKVLLKESLKCAVAIIDCGYGYGCIFSYTRRHAELLPSL